MIAFTKRKKKELKKRIVETRITVGGHILVFNTEGMMWLGVYQYTEAKFAVHKNLTLEKDRKTKYRVRRLTSTRDPSPGPDRKIKVPEVQVVALYSAKFC